jgi:N-acetyl-gamma-glutamyl-phosphate reductase
MQVLFSSSIIPGAELVVVASPLQCAVIGGSGYSGLELLRLLAGRGDVAVRRVFAGGSAGKTVAEVSPSLAGCVDLKFETFGPELVNGLDVVFCALPSGDAMSVIPSILPVVGKVIDLGGDFRLTTPALYKEFYRRDHTAPHLLGMAVYGLSEVNAAQIAAAQLVANPGCYPTSILLALIPLLKNGLINATGIIANSLSGVTGAGKSATVDLSFSEVNENARAYKVGAHQHLPEITCVLGEATGTTPSLSFVPHLIPVSRGIYSTIHAALAGDVTENDVAACYSRYYEGARFVRLRNDIPQLRDVVRTNFCDIGFRIDTRTRQIILISVIDNLVKGAAGQAIQNMNIMFKLPQERGLL